MLEASIRVALLAVVGLAIGLAVLWYLSFVYQEIRGTGQVVIDQFTVVQQDGKADDQAGMALAQMLQARLQTLTSELQDAQATLGDKRYASNPADGKLTGIQSEEAMSAQIVPKAALPTTLLERIDMKVSVGGVDVSGVLPWLQRGLTSRRILHFTIFARGDEAQISASLRPLGLSNEGLRLFVKGADGTAPSLATIVDQLAHEILRRYFAQGATDRLGQLEPSEFFDLAEVLVKSAEARKIAHYRGTAQSKFAELAPQIATLVDKQPNWPELAYLAAWIADSGGDVQRALRYYQSVQGEIAQDTDLADVVGKRVFALRQQIATAAQLEPRLDNSRWIQVKDQGQEGSVVGQALAAALEFQIAKKAKTEHERFQISARYIYYAARKAGGANMNIDAGATIKDGLKVLELEGAVKESVWPYRAGQFREEPPRDLDKAERFRITAVRQLHSLTDIQLALKDNEPVVAGIPVFKGITSAEATKTGIVPLPAAEEKFIGGHAIVIVGYDNESKRVQFANSWGKGWGVQGFGWLPYEYIEEHMSDAWTFKLAPE